MTDGGSIQTLTYLGSERVFPAYKVMGVAKAALEASVRYLAWDLGEQGIRVNAISAGPIKTAAARGIPGFMDMYKHLNEKTPAQVRFHGRKGRGTLDLPGQRSSGRDHRRGRSSSTTATTRWACEIRGQWSGIRGQYEYLETRNDEMSKAMPADRVLVNARVLTMAGDRAAEAVAIADGRVLAARVGCGDSGAGRAGTVVEDLGGATVMPGLIDAHNHLLMTGQILQQVQLYDCRSIDDILDRVRTAVEKAPPGTWILGRGWDESLLAERRHPNRHDLDRVAPDHPVVLHRVWNRLVANSRAIELAGISRRRPIRRPISPTRADSSGMRKASRPACSGTGPRS